MDDGTDECAVSDHEYSREIGLSGKSVGDDGIQCRERPQLQLLPRFRAGHLGRVPVAPPHGEIIDRQPFGLAVGALTERRVRQRRTEGERQ